MEVKDITALFFIQNTWEVQGIYHLDFSMVDAYLHSSAGNISSPVTSSQPSPGWLSLGLLSYSTAPLICL